MIITASFGVAAMSVGQSLPAAIKDADTALYQAKNNGRNRVCCFESAPACKAAAAA